jgi:hypothetical protein
MYKNSIIICSLLVCSICVAEQDPPVMLNIEAESAKLNDCNKSQPCNINIKKTEMGYSAIVVKVALVTKSGVLKYLPSAIYYHFNDNGEFLKKVPTP